MSFHRWPLEQQAGSQYYSPASSMFVAKSACWEGWKWCQAACTVWDLHYTGSDTNLVLQRKPGSPQFLPSQSNLCLDEHICLSFHEWFQDIQGICLALTTMMLLVTPDPFLLPRDLHVEFLDFTSSFFSITSLRLCVLTSESSPSSSRKKRSICHHGVILQRHFSNCNL